MGLLTYLFVPLMKLYVRQATGFERIPKEGPAILVANHASYIDGPLVAYFTEWHRGRWVHGIQSRQWLGTGWLRRFLFITVFRQIPTNGSVEKAVETLREHGCLVMLFPEGGRTPDGRMQKATHTGLGVLASLSNAPVIPIGIQGTYDWWSRHRALPHLFRFRSITLTVGTPIRYAGKPTKQNHLAFQRKVLKAVAKLAKTEYPY